MKSAYLVCIGLLTLLVTNVALQESGLLEARALLELRGGDDNFEKCVSTWPPSNCNNCNDLIAGGSSRCSTVKALKTCITVHYSSNCSPTTTDCGEERLFPTDNCSGGGTPTGNRCTEYPTC